MMRKLMNIISEGEHDGIHGRALKQTGFWGKQGAGAIILARDTGRILLAHRAAYIENVGPEQPETWGGWGGAIDPGEDPVEATLREVSEETQFRGKILDIEPLYVFKKDSFRYSNFLVIIESEYTPRLDWENQGFKWCELGQWPTPLHFGLVALFNDTESMQKISNAVLAVRKELEAGDQPNQSPEKTG